MDTSTIPKVIRDGKVAVLYSPSFGAGWYSWNTYKGNNDHAPEDCLFNPEIVAAVEAGNNDLAAELAERKYGEGFYTGGAADLAILWLPVGTPFQIHEYDGFESVRYGAENWITA